MGDQHGSPGGEAVARRGFLKWMVGALAAVNALIVGMPFLGTFLGSTLSRRKAAWSRITTVDKLPQETPVEVRFQSPSGEAYLHGSVLNSVWVIRHGPNDATVFSSICTHLGCHFQWNQGHGRFECPCHASVFALDGTVLAGPAPRPLDTLHSKIENGALYVEYERFRVGTPEKVPI